MREGTFPEAAAVPAPTDDDALVGTLLAGRYRILQKLGEGAMGSVYLGEHVRIGRRDAIKVLRPGLEGDAEALARFERGARNASLIHHPNVCTVYDFGDAEGGRRFLSMEFVPGEPLQDLLRRERVLPPARAVAIAAQVAGALQAAHDRQIVHRDLKPANVMVSPVRGGGDAVKVVDFDIAKGSAEGTAADVTRLGYVIGTPEYMSPEQLLGLPLDGRSDVYSLALVLFEMLVGQLPGGAQNTQQRVLQRLAGTPPPLEEAFAARGTPPALRQAIAAALHARADHRVASAADFARAVEAALAEPAAASTAAAAPSPPPASAPGPRYTRGGLPPTRVAVERSLPPGAEGPASVFRAPIRRPVVITLALVVAAGAWAVARPPAPPAGESRTAADPPGATEPPPSLAHPAAIIDSAASTPPAPPGHPLKALRREEGPSVPRTARDPGRGRSSGAGDVLDPTPRVAEPPQGALDVASVLDGLEDRVGPPYPAAPELRRVRDAAGEVWDRGARLGPEARARAAFVAAHAELGLGDVDGCVRWAERAVALRAGGARQVLLDECRRVRG